ncbi:MAG TPA: anti-sigma factor antagonist [Thiotrichales bacterium]|nr:anti-sigma factor antagonist [Thiotrichales bacterium]
MSIEVRRSADRREVTISIGERFDFSEHKAFREAYRNDPPDARFRVNLASTRYLDSSALGMLLLLRKHAGGERAQVVLEGMDDGVKKILEIANFDKLFEMK